MEVVGEDPVDVACVEMDQWNCPFLMFGGDMYYCECPVRVYIANELKK